MSDVAFSSDSSVPSPSVDESTLPNQENLMSANRLETNLSSLASGIEGGNSAGIWISVRDLVKWSGYVRRRGNSERLIQDALDKLHLRTLPDFRDAHISGTVMLQKIDENPVSANVSEAVADIVAIDRDAHILKVGLLEAANRSPIRVSPGASIFDATSLMIKHNFSQLPIMADERRVFGMVNWQSITSWVLKHGTLPTKVDECMLPHAEVLFNATLFDTISTIINQECVLVRKHDKTVSGIITAADLGIQFSEMSEAFLKIGQIEAILRMIIEKYYPIEEIKNAKDPIDTTRDIKSVDHLTFGEYKRLLENTEKWAQYFKQNISRKIFIETLEEVRLIRNDVMHFDPTGINDEDLSTLSTALRFFNSVKENM
ncbi:CBS domain-containing protein [Undibacterium sp. TS12]|uniref:CBS domain-containing protein n=1 Tax=Undibacterium sp. TS12 TaxID=2908202 RepID=UPI001F4CE6D6|nr:CBS domain-containing protein [Undibacterium sp. TS12]MCH8622898.1 CBS domain-containing protein [Undibacterium sp. TS12]